MRKHLQHLTGMANSVRLHQHEQHQQNQMQREACKHLPEQEQDCYKLPMKCESVNQKQQLKL